MSNSNPSDDIIKTGYAAAMLPAGVRSRTVDNGNGLSMHVLEAGFGEGNRPCVLLLHGFPELAYSWRRVMSALAGAGYYVIAPDQRGYGLTTGWDGSYDGDLAAFHLLNLAEDAFGLVQALGRHEVAAVVGHDFGSPVAAWCALTHPEVFKSVVLLSAPFAGPPKIGRAAPSPASLAEALAALTPPRKHYQWYYTTRGADADMHDCPQGVHAFLRAYYHVKSAAWKSNQPFPLKSWAADELARMPRYYIMDLLEGMAQTVARDAPADADRSASSWLPEEELRVYSGEFSRTGFQGGLQWYRSTADAGGIARLAPYAGRTIDVPSCFIAGRNDWGTYQSPGALERMISTACTQFRGVHLVDHAGHWVQQEQAVAVAELLTGFFTQTQ